MSLAYQGIFSFLGKYQVTNDMSDIFNGHDSVCASKSGPALAPATITVICKSFVRLRYKKQNGRYCSEVL